MRSHQSLLALPLVLLLLSLSGCSPSAKVRPRNPGHRVAVSQILITFRGAPASPRDVERSREEGEALAGRLLARINEGELTFERAVAEHSDDVRSREHGGYMGVIREGYGTEELEAAVMDLPLGTLSPVTLLPDGFHIFRVEPLEYRGYIHILVSHVDAQKVPLGVKRSEEEAATMAADIRNEILTEGGTSMEELAWYNSDGMEKKRGGYFPVYTRKQLIDPLTVCWDLDVGGVSKVLTSPYGFHLFKRIEPLPEVIGLKHIMVAYAGAILSPISVTRTREEAADLARNLLGQLRDGASFNEMAREHSDDKPTRRSGGDLGLISWDEVPLEVENIAFRMKVDTLAPFVVESPGGFHLLYRYQ